MIRAKYVVLGIAAAGLTVAGVMLSGSNAGAALVTAAATYKPAQAISHYFGSKHAVGYFQQKDGQCAMTILISEDTDGRTSPSATRLRMNVKPGEKVELQSIETQTLEVSCGTDAATVEVRSGSFQSTYTTH
jgi:hypothetical protein